MMATNLNAGDVEKYLDENQQFTESYFTQKASNELIIKWKQKRCLRMRCEYDDKHIDKRDTSLIGRLRRSQLKASITEDEEMSFDAEDSRYWDAYRRHSEPHKSTENSHSNNNTRNRRSLDMVNASPIVAYSNCDPDYKRTLLQESRQRALSLEANVQHDADTKRALYLTMHGYNPVSKTSLKKSQSFPISSNSLGMLINSTVSPPVPVSLDWGQVKQLKSKDHTVFLHELMIDIAQELSLNSLLTKVISNITLMTECQHVSLVYIKDGKITKVNVNDDNHRHVDKKLLTQQDDKCQHHLHQDNDEDIDDLAIKHVIDTKLKYHRLSNTETNADNPTTGATIYAPILSPAGDVISVVCLTYADEEEVAEHLDNENKILDLYLLFCGVIITNARLFALSAKEFNRNKALLELARDIFEHQTSLEKMMHKMSIKALELLKANQCSILLLKQSIGSNTFNSHDRRRKGTDSRRVFSRGTTLKSKGYLRKQWHFDESMENSKDEEIFSDDIASYVAETGQAFLRNDNRSSDDGLTNQHAQAVLCMPIRDDEHDVIGVVKLEGRSNEDNKFDVNDEKVLEAFTIFCGLGINNSILYDKVSRAKAQQQVALEVLSYHTNVRQFEADKLKLSPIPSTNFLHLNDLNFDDFSLTDDQMLGASIRMFIDCGFVSKYHIEYETLCKWMLTVRKNYRDVIYHNWRHAFNVAQSMFASIKHGKLTSILSSHECLGLIVGCLCHDLDHRGTNNEFQMKSDSALSLLYGTSTMEHHHFNHAVMILNSQGNDIFKHLSPEAYISVMKYMRHAILATDLAQYFANRDRFFDLVEHDEFDSKSSSHRHLLRNMLMTACDLNGITKPWEIQKKVVHLVTSEFFHQGDLERDTLHVEPRAMMDRNNILDLPKMQVEFFKATGVPVYEALSKISDKLLPLYNGSMENLRRWSELSEQVDKGHVDPELEPVLIPLTYSDGPYA